MMDKMTQGLYYFRPLGWSLCPMVSVAHVALARWTCSRGYMLAREAKGSQVSNVWW